MIKKILMLTVFLAITLNISTATAKTTIYEVDINGIITHSTYEIISSAIQKASLDSDSLIMIKLNTPGGLLDSTREIVSSILSSPIPVIVYVAPSGSRAASAGAFILLAAEYAIMSEGTNVGAAHPVASSGEDIEGDMKAKVENDTTAFMKSIAEKRNRNSEPAIKMVTESLSYTSNEALAHNIIDAVVNEDNYLNSIRERFNIPNNIEIVKIEMSPLQSLISFLANPNILVALFFFGMLMIGLEMKMPGTFVFLGIGVVSLILFAVGSNIISINIFGLLLIIAGFILLILELFIVSFGLLSVASIISMIAGLLILFDGENSMGIAVSYWLILFIIGVVVAAILIIGGLVIKDFRRKSVTGADALIGKDAEILNFAKNSGKVFVHGEIWNAVSTDTDIKKGDTVIVTARAGMQLTIKKVDKNEP